MKDDRLYYADPFLARFTARVTGCEPAGETWAVTLDATAFYPEGGGQPADTGTLGEARVLDVHEREGRVVHTTDRPLPVGETVEGVIDWSRRLDHMEQHTGEHILSGTLHRLFGTDNVGFHIGADTVRMDMDKPLTPDQLAEAERLANETIRRDVPVDCAWPDAATLAATEYRSKKALEGPVRLVTVPGADCCACCGTHLARSGQVGLIKILSAQPYKGGVRLAVACGGRAFAWVQDQAEQAHAIGALLSAPAEGLYQAVERQAVQAARLRVQLAEARNAWFSLLAAQIGPDEAVCQCLPDLAGDDLRRCALAMAQRTDRPCAVFSPGEGDTLHYALVWKGGDVNGLCRELNAEFDGRGGGRPPLAQGSLHGEYARVEAWFAEFFNK